MTSTLKFVCLKETGGSRPQVNGPGTIRIVKVGIRGRALGARYSQPVEFEIRLPVWIGMGKFTIPRRLPQRRRIWVAVNLHRVAGSTPHTFAT